MRHIRVAEQALRVSVEPSSQRYICRSCLAHATRQLHTTSSRGAGAPFYKQMSKMLFGDKKAEENKQRARERSAANNGQAEVVVTTPTIKPLAKRAINGSEYEVASRYDPATEKYYLPSNTWDGLERVGGKQWAKKRLDQGEQYTGFLAQRKPELTNRQWQRLLHNVAIEVIALRQADRSVYEVCHARSGASSVGRTAKARLSQDPDGTIRVHFSSTEDQDAVLGSIAASVTEPENGAVAPAELNTQLNQINASETEVDWVDIRLHDPEIKLAIIKRAMQLSGKRIPDIQMNNASTLSNLYEVFKAKEKSKKLYQAPQVEGLAQALPNVTVHKTRRTPVHKEKQIGRWKVIADELSMRNLPVLGSRWVNAKEGLHLHEK